MEYKELKELSDVEEEFEKMYLKEGEWSIGIRSTDAKTWRIVVVVNKLSYDIAIPGEYSFMESAYTEAHKLSLSLGGVPSSNKAN